MENASTKYNDMKGSAALDFHDSYTDIYKYAKEKGIDTEKFEIIGLNIYYGEVDYFKLTFLVVENNILDKYKENNNGKLPVKKISIEEKQADFEKHFKKLKLNLYLQNINLQNFNLIEDN